MAKKLFEQPTYFSNFFSGVQSIFLLEQYHPSMGTKSKILAKSERYIFCCCQDFQRQKKAAFPNGNYSWDWTWEPSDDRYFFVSQNLSQVSFNFSSSTSWNSEPKYWITPSKIWVIIDLTKHFEDFFILDKAWIKLFTLR